MNTLTVLYDAGCELCRRCRSWMESEPAWVELEFVASSSDDARTRFKAIPWRSGELVVVADDGKYQVIRELNETAKRLKAQK